MKKLLISVLMVLVIVTGFTGCKKIIKSIFTGFDTDVPAIVFTLPPIPFVPPEEYPLGTYTQSFNFDSTIKANTNNSFNAGDVTSVKVKKIVMTLSNGNAANNFANFESARFTFSSDIKLDPVTIASVTFPDTLSTAITIIPANSPELKPYLGGSKLYYNVFGKLRRTTTQSLPITVKVTLAIK